MDPHRRAGGGGVSCAFGSCDGCVCHLSPPCFHCEQHVCEHEDGQGICDECLEKKLEVGT